VSGDVALIDAGDGAISRLIRTATTLFDTPRFHPTALVGGLAVTIRLASVHRATNDVDTVSGGAGPRDLALQYLGDRDAAEENRIEVDGVKVDVMETWPLPDDSDDLPDHHLDRLFVVGHRWALDSATPVAINAVSPDGAALVTGKLTVATVPALVACKLHALADRKGPSLSKRDSDAYDLVRLLGDLVRSDDAVRALRSAPFDLASLVASEVERWFVDGALRTARLANAATVSHDQIDRDAVSTVGRLLLEQLGE
jgi:hypothetical protein